MPISVNAPGRLAEPAPAATAPPVVGKQKCDAACRALFVDIQHQTDEVLRVLKERQQIEDDP